MKLLLIVFCVYFVQICSSGKLSEYFGVQIHWTRASDAELEEFSTKLKSIKNISSQAFNDLTQVTKEFRDNQPVLRLMDSLSEILVFHLQGHDQILTPTRIRRFFVDMRKIGVDTSVMKEVLSDTQSILSEKLPTERVARVMILLELLTADDTAEIETALAYLYGSNTVPDPDTNQPIVISSVT